MRHTQEFLLYAIVLCDSAQRSQAADSTVLSSPERAAAGAAVAAAASSTLSGTPPDACVVAAGAAPQQSADGHSQRAAGALMTAAEARRALQLYTASTGKYAAGGSAFMAPVYGVGELPQVHRKCCPAMTCALVIKQQRPCITCFV